MRTACGAGGASSNTAATSGARSFASETDAFQMGGFEATTLPSRPYDEAVHHPFGAGLIEIDQQLVALNRDDPAIAEFLMEDALADGIGRRAGRSGGYDLRLRFDDWRPLA